MTTIKKNEIANAIKEISDFLQGTFNEIDSWFFEDSKICTYLPKNKGWTIYEILEHIALTNKFLLILIDKGTNKALQNASKIDLNLENELNYIFQRDKLTEVGIHKSFDWVRPEHMIPSGKKSPNEIRKELQDQVNLCLGYLDKLKDGQGVLYKTTMSVNGLGKINVYEYIYFLAQHGKRHITQMSKNKTEYSIVPDNCF